MSEGEGEKLDSRCEAPGNIFKSAPPDGLLCTKNVTPAEWKFFQCKPPGVGPLFAPLDAVLREKIILALIGGKREEVTDSLYKRIT